MSCKRWCTWSYLKILKNMSQSQKGTECSNYIGLYMDLNKRFMCITNLSRILKISRMQAVKGRLQPLYSKGRHLCSLCGRPIDPCQEHRSHPKHNSKPDGEIQNDRLRQNKKLLRYLNQPGPTKENNTDIPREIHGWNFAPVLNAQLQTYENTPSSETCSWIIHRGRSKRRRSTPQPEHD